MYFLTSAGRRKGMLCWWSCMLKYSMYCLYITNKCISSNHDSSIYTSLWVRNGSKIVYYLNTYLDLPCHWLYTLSLTCCLSSLCHLSDLRFVSSNNLSFIDLSSFSRLPILSYNNIMSKKKKKKKKKKERRWMCCMKIITMFNHPYILCIVPFELAIGSLKRLFGFLCSPQFTFQLCNPLFILRL